jgi:hypothetical protein
MEIDRFNYQRVTKRVLSNDQLCLEGRRFFKRSDTHNIFIRTNAKENAPERNLDDMPCYYSMLKRLDDDNYVELNLFIDISTCGFVTHILDASMLINPNDPALRALNNAYLDKIFTRFLEISHLQD